MVVVDGVVWWFEVVQPQATADVELPARLLELLRARQPKAGAFRLGGFHVGDTPGCP